MKILPPVRNRFTGGNSDLPYPFPNQNLLHKLLAKNAIIDYYRNSGLCLFCYMKLLAGAIHKRKRLLDE